MHGHNMSLVTFEVALKFCYIIFFMYNISWFETEQVYLHSYSKLFKIPTVLLQ